VEAGKIQYKKLIKLEENIYKLFCYFGLFLIKNQCRVQSGAGSKKQMNKKFFFQQKILIFVPLRYFSNQFQSNHPMEKTPGKNNTITHYKLLIQ
jgi:hypothetical protein